MVMLEKAEKTMLAHYMIPKKSVLVALSGGADSVALLHMMHRLSQKYGFNVYSAHINHGLRGKDADFDENFSKSISERLGIPCYVLHADVKAQAKQKGISEELAGREIRYSFFNELMQMHDIEYTATAHHKNDNAETIIMNFMRGSSIKGLCGIPYKRERFIRPLLDVSRVEIERYCKDNSLDFVTDKTNNESIYTRNKIRNVLIPDIEINFNPNIVETITKNAQMIAQDEDFISHTVDLEYKRLVNNNAVDISELLSLHTAISMRIIRRMIDSFCGISDVSSSVINNTYEIAKKGKTGLFTDVTSSVQARIEYGKLIIGYTEADCPPFSYTIKIGERKFIPELGYTVNTEPATEMSKDGKEYFSIPDGTNEIVIRNRKSGDTFIPTGMNGTKTVKSYMIDKKIPKSKRSRTGIITISDNIAWIIGYRRDERFNFNKNGVKIWISY